MVNKPNKFKRYDYVIITGEHYHVGKPARINRKITKSFNGSILYEVIIEDIFVWVLDIEMIKIDINNKDSKKVLKIINI